MPKKHTVFVSHFHIALETREGRGEKQNIKFVQELNICRNIQTATKHMQTRQWSANACKFKIWRFKKEEIG